MKTVWNYLFLFLSLIILYAGMAAAEPVDLSYPGAVNKLIFDSDNRAQYSALAESIGFEYGKEYTYQEYADIKRENDLGIAGQYDFLLLSTGGTSWNWEATEKFNQVDAGWEMTYYANHDVTVIHEVFHDSIGTNTHVRILKICKGRNPKLNLE